MKNEIRGVSNLFCPRGHVYYPSLVSLLLSPSPSPNKNSPDKYYYIYYKNTITFYTVLCFSQAPPPGS